MPSTRSGWVVANHSTSPYSCASAARRSGSSPRTANRAERHREAGGREFADQIGDGGRLGLRPRPLPLDDLGDGVGRERLVDPLPLRGEGGRFGRLVEEEDELRRAGRVGPGLERVAEAVEVLGRDEVVGQPDVDRIRRIDRRAGEREVLAQSPRRVREQPRSADIGSEADPRLRHRQLRPLGDDANGRMAGEADPAAHGDAVGEHHDRLGVFGDARVERVLLAEELTGRLGIPRADLLVESADVAARTQPAVTRAVEQHQIDVGVVLPRVQCGGEIADHADIERVQRARAVESQASEAARGLHEDARFDGRGGFGHDRNVTARVANTARAAVHHHVQRLVSCEDDRFPTGYGERLNDDERFGMPEGQVLEFSGITKRFGAVTAVSDFSARVEPGRVTGFLGPNGAGKTTTLRVLLGLVRPTSGSATIGGVAYASLHQPLQTVGAVLEASSFHPGRTAANHLKVYAQAAGLPLARVDETLALVGLADVGGRKVGGFSLGMRQRLGLAYALLGDPGVLVLDEPANGLDPEGIKWMRGFLRRLAREGRTVFVSSHMLAEVQQTVDSVLIISRGRLVYQGALEGLADPSEFATVVDSPDRAGLSAALEAEGVSFELLRSGLTVRGLDAAGVGAIAASAGVALSSLQRRGPALEEVFLDLVSGARVHPTAAAAIDGIVPMTPVEGTADDEGAAPAGAAGVVAGLASDAHADADADVVADAEAEDAAEATEATAIATDLDAESGGAPGAAVAAAAAAGAAAWATSGSDDSGVNEDAAEDETPADLAPAPPSSATSAAATFAVASTGVIDIVPLDAGDPATDAYEDGLPLDGDPDVEALGAIDAELSSVVDADDVYDTAAAVESGELGSEGPDDEVPMGVDAADDPAVDDRPWEQYVKTDADVEADAFFASFTAAAAAEAAAEADAEAQANAEAEAGSSDAGSTGADGAAGEPVAEPAIGAQGAVLAETAVDDDDSTTDPESADSTAGEPESTEAEGSELGSDEHESTAPEASELGSDEHEDTSPASTAADSGDEWSEPEPNETVQASAEPSDEWSEPETREPVAEPAESETPPSESSESEPESSESAASDSSGDAPAEREAPAEPEHPDDSQDASEAEPAAASPTTRP